VPVDRSALQVVRDLRADRQRRCRHGHRELPEQLAEATFLATGMTADVPRTAALWLFDTRDNARLVAASPQELGDDSLILSGQLPASGTEPYRKLVVTAEPAGQEAPALPTGAVLAQAAL
jgi:anti-sigma-K factor RskA